MSEQTDTRRTEGRSGTSNGTSNGSSNVGSAPSGGGGPSTNSTTTKPGSSGITNNSGANNNNSTPKKAKLNGNGGLPRRKASRKLAFDEDKTSPVSGTIIRELAEGEEVPTPIHKGTIRITTFLESATLRTVGAHCKKRPMQNGLFGR